MIYGIAKAGLGFRTEHVKLLKRHSHSLSSGLVDFYITLTDNLTIRSVK